MAIEHIVPRFADSRKINDYENLIYICRFCNEARGNRPNLVAHDDDALHEFIGARLLNPLHDNLGERLRLEKDRLEPSNGDIDAKYFEFAYQINASRKVTRRKLRRERISKYRARIAETNSKRRALWEILADIGPDSPHVSEILRLTKMLEAVNSDSKRELSRYVAVPPDCPTRCRCNPRKPMPQALRVLPDFIRAQMQSGEF